MQKKYTFTIWLAAALMLSMLPFQTFAFDQTATQNDGKKFSEDHILVKYKNDSKHFRVVSLSNGETVDSAIAKHKGDKTVVVAEPDYVATATAVPNDPFFSPYQWDMDNTTGSGINMKKAWDISTGSGVVVAVVDTGVAYESITYASTTYTQAPDLASTCFVPGYDFINNDTHPNDDNRHGTHVTGTIAQSTNNNIGVAGVAYNACIMPVKVLDASGSGSYSAVANGIYYATDHGAQVINMSLGGSADSSIMRDAVAYAYNHGVTVVAAAGNTNSSAPNYPAAYDSYVISVGATDYAKARAPYSSYGPSVDIVAPGGDTTKDLNGDGYGDGIFQNTFAIGNVNSFGYYALQGTSMATPHVAGVAALLIAHGNATTTDDIRAALQSTAQDLGTAGRDDQFGYGLVDAFAALQWPNTPPINSAPVANAGADQNAIAGTSVFFNGTGSTDDKGIISYDWNFGDGSIGTGATTTHTYTAAGLYSVTLTVTDTEGLKSSDYAFITVKTVGIPPIAEAGADQTTLVGTPVAFKASSSTDDNMITAFNWNFGDGNFGGGMTTTHTYTAAGTYTVTLTVTDNEGLTGTDTMTVVVNPLPNSAPIANAGADQTATVKTSVSFNGSGSTDDKGIVAFNWDFGDGSTTTGATANHTYNTLGTFTVTLTVTDVEGLTNTDTATVVVNPANVVITSVETVNTQTGKNYKITLYAKNNETTDQILTYHVDVINPKGNKMTWTGLADKTTTLWAGGALGEIFFGKVPGNAVKGMYTVNAQLTVNGFVTNTKTATFTVN